MMKKTVIFVDDDANILDGLRRMLRPMRNEFEISFASGATEALQMMEAISFDIIVSDMRMPGLSGAELLTEVKKKHPHTIRIMLTGQADDSAVMQCVNVVHQFLAKPCDPEKLKNILLRAGVLHSLLNNEELKCIVSEIDSLPSLPSMYEKMQIKLQDPEVVISDIAKIVSQDIAMTAKVLQLVNSSFFGLYQKVETTERAVTLLGLDTIKALVLGVQIFSEMKNSKYPGFIATLWRHSMAVGILARKIVMEETDDKTLAGDAMLAGLLHDIGKLILVSRLEGKYENVRERAAAENLALFQAERDMLRSSHCQLGGYLVGLWGFNSTIVEAVAFHHALDEYPVEVFTPTLAVHFADAQYYTYAKDEVVGCAPVLNEGYITALGLEGQVECWQEICRAQMELHDNGAK